MNRRILICLATLLFTALLQAQTYDRAWHSNPWNDGKGATGIRLSEASGAYAESYGSFITGGLRSTSEATSAWTAGVKTAAVRHFSRFSAAGSFGYEQMWGKDMCGSMLVRPGFYPVDIYELTPGSKVRQTNDMTGDLSIDLSPSWRAGVGTRFTSANYAKRKDLRHTTYMLDLSVQPGIQYHRGRFAVALNYILSKNGETVRAEQVGTKVASYDAFLDKGLYFGAGQLWTGSGIHLDEAGVSGFPLSEWLQGGSLQLSRGGLYFGVQGRVRHGQAGEKQRVWFRFGGWDLDADLDWRFETGAGTHAFHAGFGFFTQDNDENALEQKTEGGVTTTVTVGSNRVFSRSVAQGNLRYYFAGKGWGLSAGASLTDREGASSVMYPFLYLVHLLIPAAELSVQADAGHFTFRLDAGWSCGTLKDSDREVAHSVTPISVPERLESYFVKYREQNTAQKVFVAPGVRFAFGKGLYADAGLWWCHGFQMRYLGPDRVEATLKLGYNF